MARKEFYQDPEAPRANSLVVAAVAFVQNAGGEVLLVQRSDNGLWALPGGGMEIGETVAQTAARETEEETGYRVEITGLVGVYSDPQHVIAYTDGEVRQQFALCFRGRLIDGDTRPSAETPSVRWVSPAGLGDLDIHPSMRLRIDHGLDPKREPYLG